MGFFLCASAAVKSCRYLILGASFRSVGPGESQEHLRGRHHKAEESGAVPLAARFRALPGLSGACRVNFMAHVRQLPAERKFGTVGDLPTHSRRVGRRWWEMSQKPRRTLKSQQPVRYGWRPANSDDNAHAVRSAVQYWRTSIRHSARQDVIDLDAQDPRIEFADALVAAYEEFAAPHPDYYFANTVLRELGKSDDRWKPVCNLLADHPLAETSRMAFPLATFVRYAGENRNKRAMWQVWIRVADPPPQCLAEMPTVLELPVRSSLHWRRQDQTEADDGPRTDDEPLQVAAEPVTGPDEHREPINASERPSSPPLGLAEGLALSPVPLMDARRAAPTESARAGLGLFSGKRHSGWLPIFLTQTLSVLVMLVIVLHLPELIRERSLTWLWRHVGAFVDALNLTPILFK